MGKLEVSEGCNCYRYTWSASTSASSQQVLLFLFFQKCIASWFRMAASMLSSSAYNPPGQPAKVPPGDMPCMHQAGAAGGAGTGSCTPSGHSTHKGAQEAASGGIADMRPWLIGCLCSWLLAGLTLLVRTRLVAARSAAAALAASTAITALAASTAALAAATPTDHDADADACSCPRSGMRGHRGLEGGGGGLHQALPMLWMVQPM